MDTNLPTRILRPNPRPCSHFPMDTVVVKPGKGKHIVAALAADSLGALFLSDPARRRERKRLDLGLILRRIDKKQYQSRAEKLISDVNSVFLTAMAETNSEDPRYKQAVQCRKEFQAQLTAADKAQNRPMECLKERIEALERGLKDAVEKLNRVERRRQQSPSETQLKQLSTDLESVPETFKYGLTSVVPDLFQARTGQELTFSSESMTKDQYQDIKRYIRTCRGPLPRARKVLRVANFPLFLSDMSPEEEFMHSIRRGQTEIVQAKATPGDDESDLAQETHRNAEDGDNGVSVE